MTTANDDVRYLVFDIESVADSRLIADIRHPGEDITPEEALRIYRDELMEKKGTDFVPYTFQVPVSLALAKVGGDYSLHDLKVLRVEDGGPKGICEKFWKGWLHYKKPAFVTFNGRGFDIPLMELTAFRYGVPISEWLALGARAYEQPRNRFNLTNHFDLCDFLTNNGAVMFSSGLNIASKLIRKPGKIDTKGEMVQDMYDAGEIAPIHDYCRCDVLDTYFVFLRTMLLCGRITAEREAELTAQVKEFLLQRVEELPVYQLYLDAWARQEATPDFPAPVAPAPVPATNTADAE